MCFFLTLGFNEAWAIDLKLLPAWSKTPNQNEDKTLETREALVDIEGVRYREIQYQGKKYYLKLLEREPSPEAPLECLSAKTENEKILKPRYLYGESTISHRTENFIARLQNGCDLEADVPHPEPKALAPVAPSNPKEEGHMVSHPVDQELGISFDSKEHRGKSTNSTPGGVGGGMD